MNLYTVAVLGFGGGVLHRIVVQARDEQDAVRKARTTMFEQDAGRLGEWDSANDGRGVTWKAYPWEHESCTRSGN